MVVVCSHYIFILEMAINGNLHMSLTKPPLCRQALKHLKKTTYLPGIPKNEPLSDGIDVVFTFH